MLVGFNVLGEEFPQIPNMTQAMTAARSFIQFDDISAKISTTARVVGDMVIAGIGNIGIENATIALGFGLGMVERSHEIPFKNISSVILALKEVVDWQKVGVMDVTIPINILIEFAEDLNLNVGPLISIISRDLFAPEPPSINVDLNLE